MSTNCRGLLAGAALFLLAASPSHGQSAKSPIRGLVSMGAYQFVAIGGSPMNTIEPLNAKQGIFGGLVIVATWNQLQPAPDSQIGDDNPIDQALALVRGYNRRNPQKPLGVKLRVWGGFEAPDWAKQLGGPAIDTVHNGKPRTVGRFWSPAYRRAWAKLQDLLAARFDKRPLIREVAVTSCMSFTAEPFFVPTEATVLNPLLAAGFNDGDYKRCLMHSIDDHAAWQESRLVLSVNPLRTAPNQGPGDAGFTKRVMRNCREAIGVRCVFDNHDLDFDLPTPLVPIYRFMKRQGPEIQFQTFHATPPNFDGTIRKGVHYGASAIELYQDFGGFPPISKAKLRRWAALIEQNPADPQP
jgi:hypothetical protein